MLSLYENFEKSFREALNPVAFFKAKQLEQAERYARYNDTPYSLEPNCKENPGGLRDLQVIQWVARAAQLGDTWQALAHAGIITAIEARLLARSESRLREIRIHLHLLAGRREDRLLFDYQEKLANTLGMAATEAKRASEVLMQHYYKTAKLVTQLNTLTPLAPVSSSTPISSKSANTWTSAPKIPSSATRARSSNAFCCKCSAAKSRV